MKDSDLIAEVARVWVDGGGDAEGIAWSASSLQVAVMVEIDRRREDAEALASLRAVREQWEAERHARLTANGGLGA
jgi:hypothetical protein